MKKLLSILLAISILFFAFSAFAEAPQGDPPCEPPEGFDGGNPPGDPPSGGDFGGGNFGDFGGGDFGGGNFGGGAAAE